MDSIFAEEDRKLNKQAAFWQHTSASPEASFSSIAYRGRLRLRRAGGVIKIREFYLAGNLFFMKKLSEHTSHKYVDVSWKQFDPFIETSPTSEAFGFRLGSSEKFEDLYTDCQAELDCWIPHFQSRCILLDLDKDYTIQKVIGTGNYASVMLAEDCLDGSRVAVKSVKKAVLSEEEHLRMHVHEIHALRKLQHPRIIQLLRVYEDATNIHLVIDYLRGGDLYARIVAKQRYPELKAANLFRNILEVVAYIHSAGFVHRDIKPENILLEKSDDDCEFKLADFGLSAEMGLGGLHLKCGSPGYVAPEMLRRNTYGPQVDTFSCGVLLYLLLSGRLPFEGGTANEVLTSNREGRIYFNQQVWSSISKEAIELVLKLTHPDPVQRLTPAEALNHAWLRKKSFSVTMRAPRVGMDLCTRPAEDRVSHELMLRLAERGERTHGTAQATEASSHRKKKCLASLRIPRPEAKKSATESGEADAEEAKGQVLMQGGAPLGPGSLVKELNSAGLRMS